MKRRDEELTACPRCGRPSPVTKGATLVMCWRCAMGGSDAVDIERARESSEYDWPATLKNIGKANGRTQTVVAIMLKIPPQVLAMVKAGKRPMPQEVMTIIHEKYPEHIIMKNRGVTA